MGNKRSLFNKVINVIKHPSWIIVFLNKNTKHLHILQDEQYLKLLYKLYFGKKLDLINPKTFNEKLNWLKLHDRKDMYTTMVDKIKVKDYVANIIGKEYIIPTLGIYDKFEDIDFDKLPNQFVIKCNHYGGNNGVIICKDKEKFNMEKAKYKINKVLKRNLYYYAREWPYKNVKPKILIEQYLEDESGWELKDYKVLCFNGKAKLIEIHSGRNKGIHTQDIYDINWNKTDITQGPVSKKMYDKPKNYELMLKLSEKIAKNIIHVRIDWYDIKGELKFGEITFYDGAGLCKFDNEKYDREIGDMMNLELDNERK